MVSRLVSCTYPPQCRVYIVSGVCFRDGTMHRCRKQFDFWGPANGTLGNTLSGCVTQDPRVGLSEASAIHPTYTIWSVNTRVYTQSSSHLHHARHSCSIFSALSYRAQMWTKLKINVERRSTVIDVNVKCRSMFICKTHFLSSCIFHLGFYNCANNAQIPPYYRHTSVSTIRGLYHIQGMDHIKMADDHEL